MRNQLINKRARCIQLATYVAPAIFIAALASLSILLPIAPDGVSIVHAQSLARQGLDYVVGGLASAADRGLLYVLEIIGPVFIMVSTWVLWAAGSIFDMLIQWAIIDFAQNLQQLGITDGINTVWAAFRDIANIVIIGMFIFVALSTILGLTDYGYKKFVARILIVAILINFSLFFAKFIIDTSHLAALQFYQSIESVASTGGTDTSAADAMASAPQGISGAFLQRMGIQGSLSEYSGAIGAVGRSAPKFAETATALIFVIGISVLFLSVAVLFMYGSFLLVTRAVLLIFLMMTAAAAFASYIIPGFSSHKYGFSGWWDTLIKNAMFAPLLMLFVWASLFILRPPSGGSSATFADFFKNPGDQSVYSVLFMFFITIGFLFLSIKVAKDFSTKITGFQIAANIPARGVGLSARLAGVLGRHTAGRGAQWAQRQFNDAASYLKNQGTLGRTAAGAFRGMSRGAESIAKSDMNLARTKMLSDIGATAGLKDAQFAGKKPVGGVVGADKRDAEFYAREGQAMEASDEQKEAALNAVREEIEGSQATTRSLIDTQKADAENARAQAAQGLEQLRSDQAREAEQYEQEIQRLSQNIANEADPARKTSLREERNDKREEFSAQQATFQSAMQAEEDRIRKAQKEADRYAGGLKELDAEVERGAKGASDPKSAYFKPELQSAGEIAEDLAFHRFSNTYDRLTGYRPEAKDDPIAQAAKKKIGDDMRSKRIRTALSDDVKDLAQQNAPTNTGGAGGGTQTP